MFEKRIVVDSSIHERGLHMIDLGEYGDFEVEEIIIRSPVTATYRGVWTPHPARPDVDPNELPTEPEYEGIAPRKAEIYVDYLDNFDATEASLNEILKQYWENWYIDPEIPELEIIASDSNLNESYGIGYIEDMPVTWVISNHSTDDLAHYREATEGDTFTDSHGQAFRLRRGCWVPADDVKEDYILDWAHSNDARAKIIKDR